jgi:predicted nuclease with TOPRIM domain
MTDPGGTPMKKTFLDTVMKMESRDPRSDEEIESLTQELDLLQEQYDLLYGSLEEIQDHLKALTNPVGYFLTGTSPDDLEFKIEAIWDIVNKALRSSHP